MPRRKSNNKEQLNKEKRDQEKFIAKTLSDVFDSKQLKDETLIDLFLKLKTMDKILVLLCALIILFTITMIIIYCKYQSIPDTLVACFFSAVVGECGGMSWIQTTKTRMQKQEKEFERKMMDDTDDKSL